MARNRQRSKQRQAERRARRLEQEQRAQREPRRDDGSEIPGVMPAPLEPVDAPGIDPDLAAGAPPEEGGRTDFVLAHEEGLLDHDEVEALDDEEAARLTEEEAYEEIEDWEVADQLDDPNAAGAAVRGGGEAGYAVRGSR